MKRYDVIVVGGGHAGIEAALIAAKMGCQVALITERVSAIGHTPCNPSIGGSAKGIVVREIDALGGVMGQLADESLLQMKMLNKSKGPAVWSLRSQIDIVEYPRNAQKRIVSSPNLTLLEHRVDTLWIEEGEIRGVRLATGEEIAAHTVIVTAGTYMDSAILIGHEKHKSGPTGFETSNTLSESFKSHGFQLFRLKTGTPARIKESSVNFEAMEEQPGDEQIAYFSFVNKDKPQQEQRSCYLTYANEATIAVIEQNLSESAMYSGNVEGVGPRYCPSIEDKVVRFADKQRHQVFIEPESRQLDSMYVQGMSTSMPHDVQLSMLHSIKGLEQCEVIKYGYAIEYDAIDPTQLFATLETKKIRGLFTAGQINGTSGYEEAAAQGLVAGINAASQVKGLAPFVLSRDEAYIGVMIDDLVTKGTKDPYRLLTSRAEYRLLLRHDNADIRLMKFAQKYQLYEADRVLQLEAKIRQIAAGKELLSQLKITPKEQVLEALRHGQKSTLHDGVTAVELLRRPEMGWLDVLELLQLMERYEEEVQQLAAYKSEIIEQIEIQIKYEGYIKKALQQVKTFAKLENKLLPEGIDYRCVPNLALEAQEKLAVIRPRTLGQASRVAGVNAIDISMLDMFLKVQKG